MMEYLDLTLPTPAENLALDEALLEDAEAGRVSETLRFWQESTYAVVLGSACVLTDDVDEAACQRDGVPILRRTSGGGTVLVGPGCWSFSLVLSTARPSLADIPASYRVIMETVRQALLPLSPGLTLAGCSDLAVGDRKVSGNAQRRKRSFLLHHGTLLLDFDLARIGRYLRLPRRQPEYRVRREHGDFVANLSIDSLEVGKRLRKAWLADTLRAPIPMDAVRQLVRDRYDDRGWTRRR